MALNIKSSAFEEGKAIPTRYTCEGENVSPPLNWQGVPENAKSLVLIVDDPDAPDPAEPKRTWVHWVLFNIPPQIDGLPEGANSETLPDGVGEGINDWNRAGYGGPCPPIGRHRYYHKLYALDKTLRDLQRLTKAEVLAAMKGSVIAEAQLMGTYQKSG